MPVLVILISERRSPVYRNIAKLVSPISKLEIHHKNYTGSIAQYTRTTTHNTHSGPTSLKFHVGGVYRSVHHHPFISPLLSHPTPSGTLILWLESLLRPPLIIITRSCFYVQHSAICAHLFYHPNSTLLTNHLLHSVADALIHSSNCSLRRLILGTTVRSDSRITPRPAPATSLTPSYSFGSTKRCS